MTQTGSTGLISAAITAAPLAVSAHDGDFRANLQGHHERSDLPVSRLPRLLVLPTGSAELLLLDVLVRTTLDQSSFCSLVLIGLHWIRNFFDVE